MVSDLFKPRAEPTYYLAEKKPPKLWHDKLQKENKKLDFKLLNLHLYLSQLWLQNNLEFF